MMSFHYLIQSLMIFFYLEIKDTADKAMPASYLDLHIEIDSKGRLGTKLYNKRVYLNFLNVNFPFICSNIPAAPVYGVYISQLIRYARACGSYHDFFEKWLLLTRKILNMCSYWLRWVHHFEIFTLAHMFIDKRPWTCSICRNYNPFFFH